MLGRVKKIQPGSSSPRPGSLPLLMPPRRSACLAGTKPSRQGWLRWYAARTKPNTKPGKKKINQIKYKTTPLVHDYFDPSGLGNSILMNGKVGLTGLEGRSPRLVGCHHGTSVALTGSDFSPLPIRFPAASPCSTLSHTFAVQSEGVGSVSSMASGFFC